MWIELGPLWIGLLNGLGIPVVHLFFAWVVGLIPEECLDQPCYGGRLLFPIRSFEKRLYRLLGVKRWKGLLPDGAKWVGGVGKKKLSGKRPTGAEMTQLYRECVRGELSHWLQLVGVTAFIIWTPWPWALVILLWAAISNLPCIWSLRETRRRLEKVIN